MKLKEKLTPIKTLLTWESTTLVSLYIGLPFIVYAYTDWRLALLTLVVVNFALFFFYTKRAN